MATHISLADTGDLIRWAERRDSQAGLPRLVRRLIVASCKDSKLPSFRADEGVQVAGWDGVTVSDITHPFVPTGTTGWELSTRKDVKNKADEDYANRIGDPDGLDPAQTAFVFLTLRRWPGKQDWAADKSAENHWRSVLAFDADDLETWLESAPSVHVWLSVLLGKRLDNALDLDAWWRDWSCVTHPPLTTNLLLAGRRSSAKAIGEWLRESTSSFAVRAESPEEALAVLASAIFELPEVEQEGYLARTIVARDRASLDHFAASGESLILIPTFEDSAGFARAARLGHCVVAAIPSTSQETSTTVTVERLSVEEAAEALVATDIAKEKAADLAVLARRSMMAFRRRMAVRPEVQTPAWARPGQASSVLPFFMAGAWNESTPGDLEVLAALGQTESHRVVEAAMRWAREVDPPIRSVGQIWYIASKEDGWEQLAGSLTRSDLERLETAVTTVLAGQDPRLDSPVEQRWMSTARAPHSSALREGLAETLSIMGARGVSTFVAGASLGQWAQVIVRRLLERANADWRIWASLSRQLPLLAEAAPAEFLSAIDEGLAGDQPLMQLFRDQGDPLFSATPHTGLLWALERLAWSPDHIAKAALALAKLERLDPGGKTSNRPRGSLRETFLLWHPQTAASWVQQLQVLRMLLDREPAAGWRVHADILPRFHDHSMDRSRPKWRDWAPDELPSITIGEHVARIQGVVFQMLSVVGKDAERWSDLIRSCPNLPREAHDAIVAQLETLDQSTLGAEERAGIWAALREVVAHHRSFPDAAWAMPRERLDRVHALFTRFTPTDTRTKFGWLFAHHVTLPDGRHKNWQEEERAITEARATAIDIILSESGVKGIECLIKDVEHSFQLGVSFGLAIADDHDDDLLKRYLAATDHGERDFARGMVYGRVARAGQKWALDKYAHTDLSAAQRAVILICLPTEPAFWEIAETDAAVEEVYWRNVYAYITGSPQEIEHAARKLIQFGRAFAASELLAFRLKEPIPPSPHVIADALEAALKQTEVDGRNGNFSYWVGELLDHLAAAPSLDEVRVARIEWAFAPIIRHDRPLTVLHRELSRNPGFFAELLSFIYRREDEERKESTEIEQQRGNTAYQVLDSWKSLPGITDGVLDAMTLNSWVTAALAMTAEQGRPTIGAQQVGQVLSHGPHGTDGAWPHETVRNLIESLENPEIEAGFRAGRYNSRGVVTRSLGEGGRQERELADQYAAWIAAIRDQWPRTASILASLEASYRSEAHREDDETDLRSDGIW
jgi:hypothetical protein